MLRPVLLLLAIFPKLEAVNHVDSVLVDHAYLRKAHPLYDKGTIHLYLKNLTNKEITIENIWLNNIPLENLPNDLVLWWQVSPNPIPPFKLGDISIKLREFKSLPLQIKIKTSNGQLIEKDIPTSPPLIKVTSVSLNEALDRVYLYIENSGNKVLNINKVFLNGEDVSESLLTPWRQLAKRNKDCLIIKPKEKLKQGEYVTVKVETEEGEVAEATVRVFSFFPISSWDGDTREQLNFDPSPFLLPYSENPAKLDENMRTQPPYMVYCLADNPAGDDLRNASESNKEVPQELFIGSSGMKISTYREECYHYDHLHPTAICLRDSGKFFAYFVYGELTDALIIHPCENVFYLHRPIRDGYLTALAKLASEPRPLYVLPEAFRAVGRCGASPRYPTPEELRLILYYEIAEGAKGVLYYKQSGPEGYGANPLLEKEIGRLNGELRRLKDFLRIGEPIPLVDSSNTQVEAYSLLCGDKAIVLILINHEYNSNFVSGSKPFTYKAQKNFALTVRIPSWLKVNQVYEVAEGGNIVPLRYRMLANRRLLLYIKELKLTKQIVIETMIYKEGEQ